MIRSFIARFFDAPPGGSVDASFSTEGLGWGWAFLLLVLVGFATVWAYRFSAPALSRPRRWLLITLRMILVVLFLILLVKPVLMVTLNEPVRERLLVLVDNSQSMEIKDRRVTPEDLKRAEIAAGPAAKDTKWSEASRAELMHALAANNQLKLWPRLQEKADVVVYTAGGDARPMGPLAAEPGMPVTVSDAGRFFERVSYKETTTALGSSIRSALDENKGQPLAGILVLTDGANNSGFPPEEAAQMAKGDGVPLYLYGIGITEPKDIAVHDLNGPRGAFMKERAEFTVQVRAPGFEGQKVKMFLNANGKKVAEQELTLNGEAESEVQLGFTPEEKGVCKMEAGIEPQPGESTPDNNIASTRIRVLDSKVKVLYIEQEPRWDFRYLLATLQRDRRLDVKCVLFDGDPGMENEPGSPFLKEFPQERADLVANEIIILGDVDPEQLGATRLKLLNEWVGEIGGGLIFLAGPRNNPIHYGGTPLEALFPVELKTDIPMEKWSAPNRLPSRLKLTPAGEMSPLLRLSDSMLENRQIWNGFPGVRWTAQVSRARPQAQVFLTDAGGPGGASSSGEPTPVIAQQYYGQGMVMYFGFQETYRWRSAQGEKYYSKIWNQVIQAFSIDRQLGASSRTQLKVAKPEYVSGEKALISGKIYSENFAPLAEAVVPGTLTVHPAQGADEKSELRLLAVPGRPGEYQAEFVVDKAGEYSFSPLMDTKAAVKFEVSEPQVEKSATEMNARLLQTMAQISNGKFLREEALDGLPNLISSHSSMLASFKRVELYHKVWWLWALVGVFILEWLLRRLWQLK